MGHGPENGLRTDDRFKRGSELWNLAPAHRSCNGHKGRKLSVIWRG